MRVFDSFIFFNELELLELRLNILNNVVDYFVLTESPWTVSGNPKPLYYQENKHRFAKFNHKIIHNVTESIPNDYSSYASKQPNHTAYADLLNIPIRFQRAVYNRDCSVYGMLNFGAHSDDIVLTSDADEIINPQILRDLSWFDPNSHYVCLQRAYYFKLNALYQENWMGTRVSTLNTITNTSVDMLRNMHNQGKKIQNAGWHWSFFGDAENAKLKIASYEHTEFNVDHVTSNIQQRMINGEDPLGRGNRIHNVAVDDSFPEYLLQNLEKYSYAINPWN